MDLDVGAELKRREVSAYELARAAGVSARTVYNALAGTRSRASTRRLLRRALENYPPIVAEPEPTRSPRPSVADYVAAAREERLRSRRRGAGDDGPLHLRRYS